MTFEIWQKIIIIFMIVVFATGIFIVEFPISNDLLMKMIVVVPVTAIIGTIFILLKGGLG